MSVETIELKRGLGLNSNSDYDLWEATHTRLKQLAQLLAGRDLAEDLAQEAFYRVLRRDSAILGNGGDGYPYLRTTLVNLIRDHFARLKVEKGLFDPDADPDSIEGRAVDIDSRIDISAALDQLPPTRRMVLVLTVRERLSLEKTAEMLSLPVGTVKSHKSRAKSQLRKLLGDTDE